MLIVLWFFLPLPSPFRIEENLNCETRVSCMAEVSLTQQNVVSIFGTTSVQGHSVSQEMV